MLAVHLTPVTWIAGKTGRNGPGRRLYHAEAERVSSSLTTIIVLMTLTWAARRHPRRPWPGLPGPPEPGITRVR